MFSSVVRNFSVDRDPMATGAVPSSAYVMNSNITSLEQEAILRLTEFFAVSIASKTKKNLALLATDLRPANATNCVFRSARVKTSSCLDFSWRECLLRVGTWQRATSPRSPGLAELADLLVSRATSASWRAADEL